MIARSPVDERPDLDAMLDALGADELRVLTFLAGRLLVGAKVYGPLDLATDKRDWRRERSEEIADMLMYSAFESLSRDLKGGS